jgi:hypothetical protein
MLCCFHYWNPNSSFNLLFIDSHRLSLVVSAKTSLDDLRLECWELFLRLILKYENMYPRHIGHLSSCSKQLSQTHVWRHGKIAIVTALFWQTTHSVGNSSVVSFPLHVRVIFISAESFSAFIFSLISWWSNWSALTEALFSFTCSLLLELSPLEAISPACEESFGVDTKSGWKGKKVK